MKAALVEPMGIDNLRVVEIDEPEPGPGEVLVAIRAASLNYRDILAVKGGYGRMQKQDRLIPLSDAAGEVVAVGAKVRAWKVGDRVLNCFFPRWQAGPLRIECVSEDLGGMFDGVAVEKRVFREDALVRMPASLSFAEAAALPCAAATAWNGLIERGGIRPGQRVLTQGTGGVSLFALQFAKLAGAEVYATSSSPEKLELLKRLGADHVVNHREDAEWGKTIMGLTRGAGIDHVIDIGGAETLKQSMRALKPAGTITLIGVVTGTKAELNLPIVAMQALRLEGANAGSRLMLQHMVDAIATNGLKPVIDEKRFGLSDLAEGLRYLEAGRHVGKVCIEIG
ncbi:NAD(P)-dependent alcohol dehydrogenase [Aquibium carbonis]|uniref:NAD(P)-dependent alcohol dehydrogenase n=1 Tax=Aquibium carbonis TaxID=2495581 RepID=A0A429YUA3_9HYPH|nr:NAD(P)-dependent alcohol dehydrogenase [Aquibium carbonis]RST85025.1 NAD(P)-dependent alcohol dehydrogenase [Aquibium carbonis]